MGRLCLLVGWLITGIGGLTAQDDPFLRVTGTFRHVPLTEVLRQLEADYGLGFNYLAAAVADKTVNCRFREATWREVADCLFTANDLEARRLPGNYVSIRPRDRLLDSLLHQLSVIDLPTVRVAEYVTDGITATADGREVRIRPAGSPPVPGAADADLGRRLSLLPGVVSLGESAGHLSIRGGGRDQNLVLWDGIPVYSAGHYFGMIGNFLPELVATTRLWRGGGPAAEGGRLAGVVRLETDREIAPRATVGGNVSLLEAAAHARLPLIPERSDLHVGVRGTFAPWLAGPAYGSLRRQQLQGTFFDGAGTQVPGPDPAEDFSFRELNFRWQYNPTPRQQLTLSGFDQADRYAYRRGDPLRREFYTDTLTTDNRGLSLRYAHSFPRGRNLLLEAAITDFTNVGAATVAADRVGLADERDSGIREATARVSFRTPLHGSGTLDVGAQGHAYRHRSRWQTTDILRDRERRFLRNGKTTVAAAFASYAWAPRGPWRATLGLRLPHYGNTGATYPEPRLHGSYRFTGRWLAKAAFARNHQFAQEILSVAPQQLSATAPVWTLADGDLFPAQAGRELSFGFTGQPPGWLLDLEFFTKRTRGLSALTLGFGEVEDLPLTGEARATGLDLLVKHRWKQLRSWAIYSLNRIEWRFPDLQEGYFPAANDRRHQLRLMNTYQRGRWSGSLAWRLQSGGRYTEVDDVRTVKGDRGGVVVPALTTSGLYNRRLPVFHRLDLSCFYDLSPERTDGFTARVGLSLLNVYGRGNLLDRRYLVRERVPTPELPDRFYLEELERRGLGFTPNLRVAFGYR